jgi:HEAT repeat protein
VTVFVVPSMSISSPDGKQLIPNPAGREAAMYKSLEEAAEAVRRAGFDALFEGRVISRPKPARQRPELHLLPDAFNQAVPLLVKKLAATEPAVVAQSVFALGELRKPDALPYLLQCLGHEDATVRRNLAEALAKLPIGDVLMAIQNAYRDALESTDTNAVHIRLTVINTCMELLRGDRQLLPHIYPLLHAGLDDDSWLVQSQAAMVIGMCAQMYHEVEQPLL